MRSPAEVAWVECYDSSDTIICKLEIRPLVTGSERDGDLPAVLETYDSPMAAAMEGEARWVLRENSTYSVEIFNLKSVRMRAVRLRRHGAFRVKSAKSSGSGPMILQTMSSSGTVSLVVEALNGKEVARGSVEVQSTKIDYREEYRGMICGIAARARDYLFKVGASSSLSMIPRWSGDPASLQQQLEFLRGIMRGREFWQAIDRVLASPHEKSASELGDRRLSQVGKATSAVLRQISSRQPRSRLQAGSRLRTHLEGLDIHNATFPNFVAASRPGRTRDTAENRAIKHILSEFSRFLRHALHVFEGSSGSVYKALVSELRTLLKALAHRIGSPVFSEVADAKGIPSGSPVLQKKPGYRDLHKFWMLFQFAAKLRWEEPPRASRDESGFQVGKRELPDLYEAWTFFVLLDLFCEKFAVPREQMKKLLRVEEFSIVLSRGEWASFEGLRVGEHRLSGAFYYNRHFKWHSDAKVAGSWTKIMRPDFTMSFWPSDLSSEEAEAAELIIYLHFDAKYKVEDIAPAFAENERPAPEEPADAQDYKRDDLLKMHAYHDAIRRSEGAFVIYPGKTRHHRPKTWQKFHEILPGLGAFPLRPTRDGSAEGKSDVSQFLDEVLEMLADRSSSFAHRRYLLADADRLHKTARGWDTRTVNRIVNSAGIESAAGNLLPAQEIKVIVGSVKSEAHLQWIEQAGLYNLRLGEGNDSLSITLPDFGSAHLIVLFDLDGKQIPGMWKVVGAPQFTQRGSLPGGYPEPSQEWYAVLRVDRLAGLKVQFDPAKVFSQPLHQDHWTGQPFQCRLVQIL